MWNSFLSSYVFLLSSTYMWTLDNPTPNQMISLMLRFGFLCSDPSDIDIYYNDVVDRHSFEWDLWSDWWGDITWPIKRHFENRSSDSSSNLWDIWAEIRDLIWKKSKWKRQTNIETLITSNTWEWHDMTWSQWTLSSFNKERYSQSLQCFMVRWCSMVCVLVPEYDEHNI